SEPGGHSEGDRFFAPAGRGQRVSGRAAVHLPSDYTFGHVRGICQPAAETAWLADVALPSPGSGERQNCRVQASHRGTKEGGGGCVEKPSLQSDCSGRFV